MSSDYTKRYGLLRYYEKQNFTKSICDREQELFGKTIRETV